MRCFGRRGGWKAFQLKRWDSNPSLNPEPLNAEPTPFDHIADAVFNAAIGEVLPGIVGPEA